MRKSVLFLCLDGNDLLFLLAKKFHDDEVAYKHFLEELRLDQGLAASAQLVKEFLLLLRQLLSAFSQADEVTNLLLQIVVKFHHTHGQVCRI